jgi:hypothetical protein
MQAVFAIFIREIPFVKLLSGSSGKFCPHPPAPFSRREKGEKPFGGVPRSPLFFSTIYRMHH